MTDRIMSWGKPLSRAERALQDAARAVAAARRHVRPPAESSPAEAKPAAPAEPAPTKPAEPAATRPAAAPREAAPRTAPAAPQPAPAYHVLTADELAELDSQTGRATR